MVNNNLKEELINYGAIQFGEFTLASGKKSNVYINIKDAITHPEILKSIAEMACTDIDLNTWERIAGVAVGAVPLAVAVSLESSRPYSIIRKDKKDHGIENPVIGDMKGKKVLLIEDVTTSGGSCIYGIECIRAVGGIIDTVITVVDREQGAEALLNSVDVKLISMIKMKDLINGA